MQEGQGEYNHSYEQQRFNDAVREHIDSNNFQRWLLDDSQEIAQLQLSLRGIRQNPVSGNYETYKEDRIMSDAGARWLTETFLMPILREARVTNLKEEDINETMEYVMNFLNIHFFKFYNEYQMNYHHIDGVLELVEAKLHLSLRRSLDGLEQERLGRQNVRFDERSQPAANQPQDVGMLNPSNGFSFWK